MARQRFDSAPQFNVGDDGVIIQQASGSSAVPFQILNSDATPVFTVSSSGTTTATLAPELALPAGMMTPYARSVCSNWLATLCWSSSF
jgi:hypothetical protein